MYDKKETLPLCRERACGHRNNRISRSTMLRHVESASATLKNRFSRYSHVGLTAMYPLSISSYKSHFPTRVAVSTIENSFMGFPSFSRLSDGSPIRIYIIHLLGKRCKYLMRIHSDLYSLSITCGRDGHIHAWRNGSASGLYPDGSGFESQSVYYMGLWCNGNTEV